MIRFFRIQNWYIKKWLIIVILSFLLIASAKASLKIGGNFSLTDQFGKPFELKQLRGEVVLLLFGYTSCPDVCPLEVSQIAAILKKFSDQHKPVKGLFISVDYKRDTPKILNRYLSYFNADILGLSGSKNEIDSVVKKYHASYKIETTDQGNISVDHSSNLFVINQQGELDTLIPFGMSDKHIFNVVEWLLNNQN